MSTMKALGVSGYGPTSNLETKNVPVPGTATGRDLLIQVKAASVNPIDVKVRSGKYDDAPDCYERVPKPFHIIAPDGAGVVVEAGPARRYLKPGDEIFYGQNPIRQGATSEYQLVGEQLAAHKPKNWDFVESAALTVSAGTAWEALDIHLGVKFDEQAGILIINGSGGVGSMASQLARHYYKLPAVVTTAWREETKEWSRKMGATDVIDHHKDLQKQIAELNLSVPIKYIFILHSTAKYLKVSADICAPFGKICSVVQGDDLNFYGTKFMSKSLTFAWCWLGTKSYHGIGGESQHQMIEKISQLCSDGVLIPCLTRRLKLTRDGLKEAHDLIEANATIGKIGLDIDEEGEREAFS